MSSSSLDWIDLAGTMRQACGGRLPDAKVIQCSLDPHLHNGWSMDYQALPATDLYTLASPDRLVERLLEALAPVPARPVAQPRETGRKPGAGYGGRPTFH